MEHTTSTATAEYAAQIERWRRQMDEKLRAPDGWLTLIGLFWLAPGPNAIGADPASAIVLPAGKAPERAGQIDFDGLVATLRPLLDTAAA
ncbi:MAG TPA: hypothetical protein PLO33_17970, partial [Kouleothrix sp.]|nr:hypothetical protein [Kouleothrix sp.]